MTRKLFWSDSHLTEFRARVVDSRPDHDVAGRRIVLLEETAFYPLGGGQPADRGKIGSLEVVDVQIDAEGTISHFVEGESPLTPGDEVQCEVDREHRREMTQQHTGQHILSQAFFRLYGAETRGFRINKQVAEIDLALEAAPEDFQPAIERAEALANEIVFDDREIRTHLLTQEEAARLPLRKETFVSDCVRVVEIDEFDWSPCGGTHATRTGEVGMIVVCGFTRAKQMLRVEFACGVRALNEYRASNRVAQSIARRLTVGREDAAESVTKLIEENKSLSRRGRELAELASRAEARDLLEEAPLVAGKKVIRKIFDDRGIEDLKLLAHRLTESSVTIALLATRENGTARLVFARSPDAELDVSALMRSACERLGGRGGGKPDFAQGGGTKVDDLSKVLDEAAASVTIS